VNRDDLPSAQESQVLSEVVDAAAGVPVFGAAVGLVRLLEKAASGQRRKRRIRIGGTARISSAGHKFNRSLQVRQ
jgi:hypothetical protein